MYLLHCGRKAKPNQRILEIIPEFINTSTTKPARRSTNEGSGTVSALSESSRQSEERKTSARL